MTLDNRDEKRKHNTYLIGILALSVLLRVGAAVYLGNEVNNVPGAADQLSYHALAQRVLDGHGFTFGEPWWPATRADAPTAHWSYLYTFYLVFVYGLFGPFPLVARVIQAVLIGLLQPYLVYRIGRHLFNNPIIGLASAALTAGYVYLVYYAAALMTESFYILSLLGALYLALLMIDAQSEGTISRNLRALGIAIGFGLSLGAAVLLRQLILLFVPFLFLWILYAGRQRGRLWSTFSSLIVAGALLVAVILPFAIYNYARFGQFVLLNTNAGFAFFWGNHPVHGIDFQSILSAETATYGELIPPELSSLNEAQLDQELLRRGIQFVVDDPGRYILLSLSRIPSYFMFWPSKDSSSFSNVSRVASFGLLWPLMLYGLILAFKERSLRPMGLTSPPTLLILFMLCYTGIHLLSWALIRYRLPVDAILLIFAGLATVDITAHLKRWLKLTPDALSRSNSASV